MEPERSPDKAETQATAELTGATDGLPAPGLEEFLTSDVVLDLLTIPKEGLIRISAALLFLGSNELFAFYWRDAHDHGRQHCKLLSADAVRAAFHSMPFESGWLPEGTLRLGIDATGTRWFSVYVPPARRQLRVIDDDFGLQEVTVPLPGLVFTGCGSTYWVWAVKDAQVRAQSEISHAPLSNVGPNGSICFGANHAPEAEETTMQQALHLFLDSPFNGHLASGKSRRHPGDVRYLLTELTGQDVFPGEDLFPITTREQPAKALALDFLLHHVIHVRR